MLRSPTEKCNSEPNLVDMAASKDTPIQNITLRNKRKREDEFMSFKSEISEMMSTLLESQLNEIKKNTQMLNEIKQSNRSIEDAISFLSEKYEESQNKISKLEAEAREDRKYIGELEHKILDLQRDNRKTNIMIKNVPIHRSETKSTLINMISKLEETVACPIRTSEIKDIYRIKKNKKWRLN